MSAAGLVDFKATDDLVTMSIDGSDVDSVADLVQQAMTREKYRLESGTATDATYGIGNDIVRLLLGAFAKRYKFDVSIKESGGKVRLSMKKAMTGWSGGVIGAMKMKSELKRMGNVVAGHVKRGGGVRSA